MANMSISMVSGLRARTGSAAKSISAKPFTVSDAGLTAARPCGRWRSLIQKVMPVRHIRPYESLARWTVAALFLVASLGSHCQAAEEPFPPHRVLGQTYYVGSKALATYLIETPEGHIVINSGFEETVPLIRASIESLGFRMKDVKIILASHAHSDHVAGHAALQQLTGAKVYVMKGDDQVVSSGGAGQYLYVDSRWPACQVDRVLKDGDEVTLGGKTLVARSTPGHTKGCTTWTWKEDSPQGPLDVVVIGSPNVNPGYRLVDNKDYPEIAQDFARTFEVLKKLRCDVFLGAHGDYYGMLAKYERLKDSKTNPFIDPQGYRDYVTLKEKAFEQKLKDQSAQ